MYYIASSIICINLNLNITSAYVRKMNFEKLCFRECLHYEFKLGHSAADAHRNLCIVFGSECPNQSTCQRWFNKFKSGDFSLEDQQHPGRFIEMNSAQLLALVNDEPRLSTRELEKILGFSHMTIYNRLIQLGFVQKLGAWIPHQLTDPLRWQPVAICDSLLNRKTDLEWLKQIVTGDEKWVLYANHTRKRQWVPHDATPEPDPKPELHPKKVMLFGISKASYGTKCYPMVLQ